MTYKQYTDLCQQDPYYLNRWDYYDLAQRMAKPYYIDPGGVLEIGPGKLPLIEGSRTMQRPDAATVFTGLTAPTYIHDAAATPWPVPDRAYDLVIALQVWEHLGESQADAAAELKRIGTHYLLSFPFLWDCPADPVHHWIDLYRIEQWTPGLTLLRREFVGADPKRRRVVCLYC